MVTLEAKVDELRDEIRKLTEEISSDEEEITRERFIVLKSAPNMMLEFNKVSNELELLFFFSLNS